MSFEKVTSDLLPKPPELGPAWLKSLNHEDCLDPQKRVELADIIS